MKKTLGILILLFAFSSAQSQVLISLLLGDKLNSPNLEFGLEGGYNWSNIGNMEGTKSLSALNLGFYFDFKMKDQLSLYTGVLVKSKLGMDRLSLNDLEFLNADVYNEDGDYSQVINYFIVPALAKYNFKNHFYFELGPQFGLMYKAWVEYNSDVDGTIARIREYNKDDIQRLDAGVAGGFGYKLLKGKGMTIGVKYYYGFVDVYKNRSGTNNSSLFAKINIPIGGSKDEK